MTAPVFVQGGSSEVLVGGDSVAFTYANPISNGNTLRAFVSCLVTAGTVDVDIGDDSNVVVAVGSLPWTLITGPVTEGLLTQWELEFQGTQNTDPGVGSTTVTATFALVGGSAAAVSIVCAEYTDVGGVDVTSTGTLSSGSGMTLATGTFATHFADETIIASNAAATAVTWSPGAGYTQQDGASSPRGLLLEDQALSSSTSLDASMTASVSADATIIAVASYGSLVDWGGTSETTTPSSVTDMDLTIDSAAGVGALVVTNFQWYSPANVLSVKDDNNNDWESTAGTVTTGGDNCDQWWTIVAAGKDWAGGANTLHIEWDAPAASPLVNCMPLTPQGGYIVSGFDTGSQSTGHGSAMATSITTSGDVEVLVSTQVVDFGSEASQVGFTNASSAASSFQGANQDSFAIAEPSFRTVTQASGVVQTVSSTQTEGSLGPVTGDWGIILGGWVLELVSDIQGTAAAIAGQSGTLEGPAMLRGRSDAVAGELGTIVGNTELEGVAAAVAGQLGRLVAAGSVVYTSRYRAIAVNVSTTELATSLGAVPRDAATEDLLGLQTMTDTTSVTPPNLVTRTIVQSAGDDGPIPNPELAAVLQGFYSATFARALSTPVTADPVQVS